MAAFMVGCAHHPLKKEGDIESGLASFYANSMRGHKTSSGERYNPKLFTAAHRSLPFGSRVEVRNKANGRSVDVRINDRGPFITGRVIDVSYAAAKSLGMIDTGVADVEIRLISVKPAAAD